MTLAKLTITPMAPDLQSKAGAMIEVPFNPTSYRIEKGVSWTAPSESTGSATRKSNGSIKYLNAPPVDFNGGNTRTLTLDLFFDVTEPILINGQKTSFKDVREITNLIAKLTQKIEINKSPPVCIVSWGNNPPPNSDFPFQGVITNLTQNFTLFKNDGSPVRANLTVSFREFLLESQDCKKTDPELTTRLVKRGDTLSRIAAEVYRDPTRWRTIAEANHLDDPRQIETETGKTLVIPKLD
ncbi:CIS tube protein [Pantanalinema rosaneae CENA516]|uniref:CIS tube protein n=1 Tax=Pantanalinema rosaneae TaxID=1620701 RepID=UPI003D6F4CDC